MSVRLPACLIYIYESLSFSTAHWPVGLLGISIHPILAYLYKYAHIDPHSGSYRCLPMNILPNVRWGKNQCSLCVCPGVPRLSFTTVCDSRQFGCLSEYHHDQSTALCMCMRKPGLSASRDRHPPTYPTLSPRQCRTLEKRASVHLMAVMDWGRGRS